MTSYNSSGLFVPGSMANKYTQDDWMFQGNNTFDPVYEGNFEADIDAIAESIGDDSGYYSNDHDSSEANKHGIASYGGRSSPSNVKVESAESVQHDHFYTAAAASNQSNRGSIYEGTLNKSTTHLENRTSLGKHLKETRVSKTVYHPVHEYERKTPHKYSTVKIEAGDSLKNWETTYERHEWLAYRLDKPSNVQPSRRRKTSSKK